MGFSAQSIFRRRLEVDAKRYLTGTIAGIVCGLHSCQHAEGARVADICSWDSVVSAVDDVSECGFKAHPHTFAEVEYFGQACCDSDGSRTLQRANCRIAGLTKLRVSGECIEIEVILGIAVSRSCRDVGDSVGSRGCAALRYTDTGRIVAGAHCRRQPRSGLQERNGIHIPATKRCIQEVVAAVPLASASEGKLVGSGYQQALPRGTFRVASERIDVEAVRDGETIDSSRWRGWWEHLPAHR